MLSFPPTSQPRSCPFSNPYTVQGAQSQGILGNIKSNCSLFNGEAEVQSPTGSLSDKVFVVIAECSTLGYSLNPTEAWACQPTALPMSSSATDNPFPCVSCPLTLYSPLTLLPTHHPGSLAVPSTCQPHSQPRALLFLLHGTLCSQSPHLPITFQLTEAFPIYSSIPKPFNTLTLPLNFISFGAIRLFACSLPVFPLVPPPQRQGLMCPGHCWPRSEDQSWL